MAASRQRRWMIRVAAAAALAIGLAACNGNDTPPVDGLPPDAPMEATVRILDPSNYDPDEVSVAAGGSVQWVHEGQLQHTVTSDDGFFDTGRMEPGETFAYTFDAPGTYPYYCMVHVEQRGTVTVVG